MADTFSRRLVQIAHNCDDAVLRGQTVLLTGIKAATWFDGPRYIVRTIERDGSLGQEYLIQPGIVLGPRDMDIYA